MIYNFSSILMRAPLQSLQRAYDFSGDMSPLFREGMYLSSEAFWNEFQKKDALSEKEKEKLQLSFTKYHVRSCSRCTPYGTFAGSTLVNITDEVTRLTVDDAANHVRKIRIDMNYMTEIINALMRLPHIKEAVKLFTNNSIYDLGDSYRYAQYTIRNNTRYYQLTSLEKTAYLKSVLAFAENGATINNLVAFLMNIEDVDNDEATEFILNMYDSQLLISDLEPCVTGLEPLDNLILQLEALGKADELLLQFKKIQQIINGEGRDVDHYQLIERELKALNIDVTIPKNTIQTDLFLSVQENHINKDIIQTIIDQQLELHVLSKKIKNQSMDDFKTKFIAKYEGQEIPLALALDVELGIGYAGNDQSSTGGNALINDIIGAQGALQSNYQFDYLQRLIHSKYHDFLENKKDVIELTEADLAPFKKDIADQTFPSSFYLFGSILKKDNDPDPQNFKFDINVCTGPSAGNLLARFTHGDAGILELTKEILKEEENDHKDAIYAEIAHFPQARVGNVLLRPVLRNYEIPYVGKSGIAPENQIPVNDIVISIRNNEIVLRSLKHNKRVIPRLTTAHNFKNMALPIYRFLGDLQYQKLSHTSFWDWGILGSLQQLPRVVYKNLIIEKAKWKVELKALKELPKNREEYLSYFKEFTGKLKIPQCVSYIEADNKLFINFNYIEGIDLFLHYIKRYGAITIEEFLFNEENCIVKDNNGAPYTNEFIIPLYRKNETKERLLNNAVSQNPVKRKFSLNSEWLYFKIYCGPTIAEKLLKNELLQFVEEGIKNRFFEKFFFLRYKDDSSHIRIRFSNTDVSKQLVIQQKLMEILQPLLDADLIEKVALDTYVRELERYGDEIIEESESLFFNDSLAVLRFISLLDGEEFEKYRVFFAIRGIDNLLDDFSFSIAEKKDILKTIASGFLKEFGGHSSLEKQLNDKYRIQQKEIFSHMNPKFDIENEIEEAVDVFKKRSAMNRPVIEAILKKINNNALKRDDILRSYIHMFVNRLFVNNQRKYELAICHFLERYYTSQFAIAKKQELIK
jgi:thiopeptide-type bacteriocin biosynthesis protein